MNSKKTNLQSLKGDFNRDQISARLWPIHECWKKLLGLDDWNDDSYLSTEDDGGTQGECEFVSWEYKSIRIKYYPTIGTLDDRRLEWVVVHELTHVLTIPNRKMAESMAEKFDDDEDGAQQSLLEALRLIDERVVSDLTYAFLRVAKRPVGSPDIVARAVSDVHLAPLKMRTIDDTLEVVK